MCIYSARQSQLCKTEGFLRRKSSNLSTGVTEEGNCTKINHHITGNNQKLSCGFIVVVFDDPDVNFESNQITVLTSCLVLLNKMFKCNPWGISCIYHLDLNGSFAEFFSLKVSAQLLSLHREWGKAHYTHRLHTVWCHSYPGCTDMDWWQWKASSFLPSFVPLPSIFPAWI